MYMWGISPDRSVCVCVCTLQNAPNVQPASLGTPRRSHILFGCAARGGTDEWAWCNGEYWYWQGGNGARRKTCPYGCRAVHRSLACPGLELSSGARGERPATNRDAAVRSCKICHKIAAWWQLEMSGATAGDVILCFTLWQWMVAENVAC